MFEKMCSPAKIYFGIAVLASLYALIKMIPIGLILSKLFFAVLWTFILSWLCKKGYTSVSWFLVLFPYVVLLLAAMKIAYIVEHKEIFKAVHLQDAYGEDTYVEGMSKATRKNLSLAGLLVGFIFVLGLLFFLFNMFIGSTTDSTTGSIKSNSFSSQSSGIPSLPSSFSSIF